MLLLFFSHARTLALPPRGGVAVIAREPAEWTSVGDSSDWAPARSEFRCDPLAPRQIHRPASSLSPLEFPTQPALAPTEQPDMTVMHPVTAKKADIDASAPISPANVLHAPLPRAREPQHARADHEIALPPKLPQRVGRAKRDEKERGR